MIASLSGRASFNLLRRDGLTARSKEFSLVMRPDSSLMVLQVAFSIPRAVGPAVVRNQLRRRLRELFRARVCDERLTSGQVLVICRPSAAHLSFRELSDMLDQLIESCGPRRSRLERAIQ